MIEDMADNERWKEDLWDEIEGENRQQIQQCQAHNCKVTMAHEKKMKNKGSSREEELQKHHHHN